jgi:XTP/dITP diphosphohydrolase
MVDANLKSLPKKLLLATRNQGKVREFQEILGSTWTILTLGDLSVTIPEIPETQETFEGNAFQKALFVSQYHKGLILADDSGLEVDALGGRPGVYSARFAGIGATHEQNMEKLLKELENLPLKNRNARFCCVLALVYGGEILKSFEGTCEGRISLIKKGTYGFGYDPIFVPEGHDVTFAELENDAKNVLSHRAKAIDQMVQWLKHF